MNEEIKSEILIIGGGASGLMAAYGAASIFKQYDKKYKITILEKMPRPGRKIIITGKGRCNITNLKDWNNFSTHIRTKSDFVKPAFYNLSSASMVELLQENGLETVTERGDRIYPASYHSMDVVDTLAKMATANGAILYTECEVENVIYNKSTNKFHITSTKGKTFSADKIIIATGGLSYPATGSTGDGYAWAENFGHKIKTCFPSLTAIVPNGYKSINIKGHIDKRTPLSEKGEILCGIKLKNVGIALFIDGDIAQQETGDIDFTDGGIEGPIGFQISRNCVKAIINGSKTYITIDMKPAVKAEELSLRIKDLWDTIKKDSRNKQISIQRSFEILMEKLMPRDLIKGFLKWNPEIAILKNKNFHINFALLTSTLKSWKIDISGYVGYERAVITAGGISTESIIAKTLESKHLQGLYFCGEIIDMDCDTGGYNLQAAFSTGYLAGQSAAKSLLQP